MAETMFDKLWEQHRVLTDADGLDVIAIDRVILHERTGGVALQSLAAAGHQVAYPDRVFSIMDHIVSFRAGRGRDEARMPGGETFITETRALAQAHGVTLIDTDDPRQGIVHVVAPELGLVMPGVSIVCPDSHTCSLGAFGALAWGIGSSEAEHAMATGTLRLKKPPQMRVWVQGLLTAGATVKDLALAMIARFGTAGGKRCAVEYAGPAISALSMEERLTLCNLAVEFAAFTAVIAPDAVTFAAVKRLGYGPTEAEHRQALEHWRALHSDPDAVFAHELSFDASTVVPFITWGTSPGEGGPLKGAVPEGANPRALDYMGLSVGQRLLGLPIEGAFIGSCTNGRLSDLRAAAVVLKGQRVARGVRAVCVPGSRAVMRQAEDEGLDVIFRQAGFEWGEPGCAMCFYAGGETFAPQSRVISSTNRNFQGRQGPGVRTHLASPAVVAASAIFGAIASVEQVQALPILAEQGITA